MEDIMIMTGVLCGWQERALTAWLSLSLEGILQGALFFLISPLPLLSWTHFSFRFWWWWWYNEKCRQKARQATLTIEVQDSKDMKEKGGEGSERRNPPLLSLQVRQKELRTKFKEAKQGDSNQETDGVEENTNEV